METVRKDPLGSAWVVIAALGFAVMSLSVKAASTQFGFPSGELVFWHMPISTLFLDIMVKAQGNAFSAPYWKTHPNRSVVGTLAVMCTFYSVIHLPLATGVTFNYTSSIWLAISSFFILKEWITLYTQIILVMGFISVILLLGPSFQGGQEFTALASLAGGVMSGRAYLQVRELSLLSEPSWRVVFYLPLTGLTMGTVRNTIAGWHPLTVSSLPYLTGIGISAIIAQLVMARAYKVGKRFTAASLSYPTIIFSALSGALLFDGKITWQEAVGVVITAAGGVFSSFTLVSTKKFLMKQWFNKENTITSIRE